MRYVFLYNDLHNETSVFLRTCTYLLLRSFSSPCPPAFAFLPGSDAFHPSSPAPLDHIAPAARRQERPRRELLHPAHDPSSETRSRPVFRRQAQGGAGVRLRFFQPTPIQLRPCVDRKRKSQRSRRWLFGALLPSRLVGSELNSCRQFPPKGPPATGGRRFRRLYDVDFDESRLEVRADETDTGNVTTGNLDVDTSDTVWYAVDITVGGQSESIDVHGSR